MYRGLEVNPRKLTKLNCELFSEGASQKNFLRKHYFVSALEFCSKNL